VLWLAPPALADPPTWTSTVGDQSATVAEPGDTAVVTWSDPTASDDNGTPTVICSPSSGSSFGVGSTTVTCTATDTVSLETATQTFNVIVTLAPDTTPPVVTVPNNGVTAEATGPSGAVVTYTASATDDRDGPLTPTCDHPSGSTFPLGSTTVTCSATDTSGNTGTASFTVTVADTTPPVVTVPQDITVQATRQGGAAVTFSASAVDTVDGSVKVSCNPSSGATFPVGTTTVTCTAKDSSGNVGSASFTVKVVGGGGGGGGGGGATLSVVAPDPIRVVSTSANGVSATNPAVAAFLDGASSKGGNGSVKIASDAPPTFPIGVTQVTFRASDSAGDTALATSTVTVVAAATAAATPTKPDKTPPDDVSALTGALGNRSVILRWQNPKSSDFDHVEILRSFNKADARQVVVYEGASTLFRAVGLRNGTAYRFVVVAVDHAGNRSAGIAVVAKPGAPQLVRPLDGASVRTLPRLLWVPRLSARYYNVQLFLGAVKVLSVWPTGNSFRLPRSWTYHGKKITLKRGQYHWFVWPGLGSLKAHRYGPLIGGATFTVKA
jgi:hypothetical protein